MAQAKEGRLHILGEMAKTIAALDLLIKMVFSNRYSSNSYRQDRCTYRSWRKEYQSNSEDFSVSVEIEEDGTVKFLELVTVLDEVKNLVDLQINGQRLILFM